MPENKNTFDKYGRTFQENLLKLAIQDRHFFDQVSEVLEPKFFTYGYLAAFYVLLAAHRDEYKVHPSKAAIFAIVGTKIVDESYQASLRRLLVELYDDGGVVGDADFVRGEALEFCKNQKLMEAILESAELLVRTKVDTFDLIRKKINEAVGLGLDRDTGDDLLIDFDKRYDNTARSVISNTCITKLRLRSNRVASTTITVTSGRPNKIKSRAISSS